MHLNLDQKKVLLEISRFGFFFLPLSLILLFSKRSSLKSQSAFRKVYQFIKRYMYRSEKKFVFLFLGVIGLSHLLAVIARHFSFQHKWDLSIYANACGNQMFSSLKGNINLLGDHFEPLMYLLTPLCSVLDPALTLLSVQVLSFYIGAIGIYFVFRSQKNSRVISFLFSFAYLQFNYLVGAVYSDFHLISLAIGLIPWFAYAVFKKKYVLAFLVLLCLLGLKENMSLSLVGLGLFLLFQKKYKESLVSIFVGLLLFALIMKVIYPHFRGGEETVYFKKYYGHIGSSLGDFSVNAFTNPLLIIKTVFTKLKIKYLALVFTPFIAVVLYKPSFLFIIAPSLAINVLSGHHIMVSLQSQYETNVFPVLFVGLALIRDEARRRGQAQGSSKKISLSSMGPTLTLASLLLILVFLSYEPLFFRMRKSLPSETERRLHSFVKKNTKMGDGIASIDSILGHISKLRYLYTIETLMTEVGKSSQPTFDKVNKVFMGYWNERSYHYYGHYFAKVVPELRKKGFKEVRGEGLYNSFVMFVK